MSQTTCCPACHTRFKVVADQLRISDGWVRCGHCKQVFDASVSLEPAAPEPMLPEIRLDQLRGPVERAVGPSSEPRAWGSNGGAGGASSRDAARPSVLSPEQEESEDLDDGFAPTQIGVFDAEPEVQSPGVPEHVPAFLKTFSSREPDVLRPPATRQPGDGSRFGFQAEVTGAAEKDKPLAESASHGALDERIDPTWRDPWRTADRHPDGHTAATTEAPQGGYELPGAQIDDTDTDWPALFDELPPAQVAVSTKAAR